MRKSRVKVYTQAVHERYLNGLYAEQSQHSVFKSFEYLTNSKRTGAIKPLRLKRMIAAGKMGTLLRERDSIAFMVSYNESKPSDSNGEI